MPPHMTPSTNPSNNPSRNPSPLIKDIIPPIPALIPALIPTCTVDDNNALPNAATALIPVPAVNAVTNAPTNTVPTPISILTHHGISQTLPSASSDVGSFVSPISTVQIYGINSMILSHIIPFLSILIFIYIQAAGVILPLVCNY